MYNANIVRLISQHCLSKQDMEDYADSWLTLNNNKYFVKGQLNDFGMIKVQYAWSKKQNIWLVYTVYTLFLGNICLYVI